MPDRQVDSTQVDSTQVDSTNALASMEEFMNNLDMSHDAELIDAKNTLIRMLDRRQEFPSPPPKNPEETMLLMLNAFRIEMQKRVGTSNKQSVNKITGMKETIIAMAAFHKDRTSEDTRKKLDKADKALSSAASFSHYVSGGILYLTGAASALAGLKMIGIVFNIGLTASGIGPLLFLGGGLIVTGIWALTKGLGQIRQAYAERSARARAVNNGEESVQKRVGDLKEKLSEARNTGGYGTVTPRSTPTPNPTNK